VKLPSPVAVEDHVSNGGGRAGAVEDAQGVEGAQGVEVAQGVEGVEGEDPEGSMRGWWDVSYLDGPWDVADSWLETGDLLPSKNPNEIIINNPWLLTS